MADQQHQTTLGSISQDASMLNISRIDKAASLAKRLFGARSALLSARNPIFPSEVTHASFRGADFKIDRLILISLLEAEVARQEEALREMGVDPNEVES